MSLYPAKILAVGDDFTVHPPTPKAKDSLIRIESPLGWWVEIRYDGTIEFSEGYEPDTAARQFWNALAERGAFMARLIDPDAN